MKKVVLSLLIVMFAMTASFAADADATFIYVAEKKPIESDGTTSAYTHVYLDMTGTEQAEIGFTAAGVSEASKKGYQGISSFGPINNSTGIILKFDKGTGIAKNNTNIYATWLIQSGQDIDLFLIGSGRMSERKSVHSETVGWKVKKDGASDTYIDCTGANEIGISTSPVTAPTNSGAYIDHHTPTATNGTFKNYGSVLLSIETEDLWAKPSGYYTANLYFVIYSK